VPRIPVFTEADADGAAELEAGGDVDVEVAGAALADGDAEAPATWPAEQPARRTIAPIITSDASQELRGRSMTH